MYYMDQQAQYRIFTVDAEGKGDFVSLISAAEYLTGSDEPTVLMIHPGTYYGSVTFQCSNLIIEGTGASPEDVRITDFHYAKEALKYDKCIFPDHPDEHMAYRKCACCCEACQRRNTFYTAVVRTDGDNITLRNLTIENTAGSGKIYGQAIALYTDGLGQSVENCRILGRQDTVFTAPFPSLNKHGVNEGFGPKGDMPRTPSVCRFTGCYISGDVDFIFGGATAFFDSCTLHSFGGYFTAPSTVEEQEFGYLFENCCFETEQDEITFTQDRLKADMPLAVTSDCLSQSSEPVWLGRPWRPYGKAVFIKCHFRGNIHPALFNDWDDEHNRQTAYFAIDEDSEICEARDLQASCPSEEDCSIYASASDAFFGHILSREAAEDYVFRFKKYISKFF